jgi:hypothetical protein
MHGRIVLPDFYPTEKFFLNQGIRSPFPRKRDIESVAVAAHPLQPD